MSPTPGFRKSTPATPATPDAAPDAAAATASTDAKPAAAGEGGTLTHGPCGTTYQPGPEGIEYAKRTRTYFCGRCGGPQAAWTFTWEDGSKLAE